MTEHMYEDEYGAVIRRAEFIEIRWYDTTSKITREGFNQWLDQFAGQVESSACTAVLVDAVQFRMDMANMDGAHRDSQVIPRYNAAGVRRFAFLMPTGMPSIGAAPSKEGPAEYLTAYFGTRAEAVVWLSA